MQYKIVAVIHIRIMQQISPKPLPHRITIGMNHQNAKCRRSYCIDHSAVTHFKIFEPYKCKHRRHQRQELIGIRNKIPIPDIVSIREKCSDNDTRCSYAKTSNTFHPYMPCKKCNLIPRII